MLLLLFILESPNTPILFAAKITHSAVWFFKSHRLQVNTAGMNPIVLQRFFINFPCPIKSFVVFEILCDVKTISVNQLSEKILKLFVLIDFYNNGVCRYWNSKRLWIRKPIVVGLVRGSVLPKIPNQYTDTSKALTNTVGYFYNNFKQSIKDFKTDHVAAEHIY